jgi:hypothetical protein
MSVFFNVFRKPTVQSQGELYPTLHNVVPNYIHMIRQMNVWQNQDETPVLNVAAKAAHKVLFDYFKKSMTTRHASVALICDPRYKMEVLEFMFEAEGGVNSPWYKKGKLHFQNVYSDYSRRAALVRDWRRQEAENKAIDARERARGADSPEVEGEENWRTDPLHGFSEFMALRGRPAVTTLPNHWW